MVSNSVLKKPNQIKLISVVTGRDQSGEERTEIGCCLSCLFYLILGILRHLSFRNLIADEEERVIFGVFNQ